MMMAHTKAVKTLTMAMMLVCIPGRSFCTSGQPLGGEPADLHAGWETLLKGHVKEGLVDYKGLVQEKDKLHAYCKLLSSTPPTDAWSKDEQLAFWLNTYNAFTVQLIVDNYPVKSIKDLNPSLSVPLVHTVWTSTKFKIGDKEYSLDDVENKVLRGKFADPRIHFAINCASMSCPPLRNEAFIGARVQEQLDDQARNFINNTHYNKITKGKSELSKIFSWFSGDFKKQGTLIEFLNKYSKVKMDANAELSYLDYDWSLNEQK
ncbi:MAG: DUF547 domain-containing protein [Flavobacteriales bacterium]|nr:DUF547 domain-containing protein [Flavobacteriales bacterium]